MTQGLEFDLAAGAAEQQLAAIAQRLADPTPLMRRLAGTLEAETEANFAAQGRPAWHPLAASTRRRRLTRNRGSSVLMILQDRGYLAASVTSTYSRAEARIGAGGVAAPYAAVHQLGGTITQRAGRVTITIPARPYLPFTGDPSAATLQSEAEAAILATVRRYLQT